MIRGADERTPVEPDKMDALKALNDQKSKFARQWYRNAEPEINRLMLLCPKGSYEHNCLLQLRGDIREFLGEQR